MAVARRDALVGDTSPEFPKSTAHAVDCASRLGFVFRNHVVAYLHRHFAVTSIKKVQVSGIRGSSQEVGLLKFLLPISLRLGEDGGKGAVAPSS
ncbi:hypothetical protein CRG98_035873 [Punica granatum]|uniref:Uncharacterized protein n=1 Tax=Punica granatum TaxID=22663 RepID=A0A2I0IID4_PUNGR|nr:hypothetical protein CRG98_035873 [Punica granatum]